MRCAAKETRKHSISYMLEISIIVYFGFDFVCGQKSENSKQVLLCVVMFGTLHRSFPPPAPSLAHRGTA